MRDAGVVACALDVADDASVTAAAAWVADALGRCDALVNNAAIDYDTDARATTADLDRVHPALETNLFGAWRTTLAFLPLLRRSPHPRVVNVSSGSGSLADMGADAGLQRLEGGAERADPDPRRRTARRRASSSTRCARAGSRPTWAAPAAGRSPTAPRA